MGSSDPGAGAFTRGEASPGITMANSLQKER